MVQNYALEVVIDQNGQIGFLVASEKRKYIFIEHISVRKKLFFFPNHKSYKHFLPKG